MSELSQLHNIGKNIEEQLSIIGIETLEQLKEIGSKQAWLMIKGIDNSACINRLYALEGAIQGTRWHHLSQETKNELKEFYFTFK